ncbi:MAG: 2-oxo acid dehydrogenase subunit E2 [Armatimonadetes bacterium]|nr:2-oxo acid dehydrogenase subunit E2 [Armatimonadota bacterium]
MTEVIMPKMGDGMEEGTLLEWLKKDGDEVKSGDVIGNIQTDKATLELESPGKGTITGFLIKEGDTVPVGQPIAAILKKDEKLPADWGRGNGKAAEPAKQKPGATAKKEPAAVAKPAKAFAELGRVKASPLAKKLANEAGVDLAKVIGSGPGGRIVAEDVRSAISTGPKVPSFQPALATGEDKLVPLNAHRRIIAERTLASKQNVPHFYVTVVVDVERISALRQFYKEEESGKVSVNDFVIKACAMALVEMPEVNATYQGDHVLQFGAVHVGVAAAVDEGLLVPVIKNAHMMTLRQIGEATRVLVAKARDGKLLPDEMQGSTFSISNMGMLNVDDFTAIINAPNAAIVAISTAKRKVMPVSDEEVEIRMMMNITGSFDHRVVDGAIGARFMNVVRDYLQNPTRLLN